MSHRFLLLGAWGAFSLGLAVGPLSAQTQDAEGCKDHALFSRMPNFYIEECNQSQFDQKHFPTGKPSEEGGVAPSTAVEGAFYMARYWLNDGAVKPSAIQVARNFQNAAKRAGATVVAEYPGWCKAMRHDSLHNGNGCILHGSTLKFASAGGKETWAFVHPTDDGEGYEVWVVEREGMKQDIAVNQLRDELVKNGVVALYINFDTGSATIQKDSLVQIEHIAKLLQSEASLAVEIGGHTDNVGGAEANQKLSEARAKSVADAVVKLGVPASRLTTKGFGQSVPVADNRTEEGRAKNRRVELVKR